MKKIYYLFVLLIAFSSCEKDEVVAPPEDKFEEHTIKKNFNLSDFEDILPMNYKIKWENLGSGTFDGIGKIVEVPIEYNLIFKKNDQNPLTIKIVGIEKSNSNTDYDFYIAKFLHREKETNVSLFDFNNFSGLLKIIGPSKERLIAQIYNNGKLLGNTTPITEKEYKERLTSKYAQVNCYTVKTEHWTDYYETSGEYIGSHLDNITYDTYCTDGGGSPGGTGGGGSGGGGTGGPGNDGGTTTYIERTKKKLDLREDGPDIVDLIVIDPSIDAYPCLKKVLDKIINSETNLVTSTINRFHENPEYDIIFKVGECTRTDNACTNGEYVDDTGEIFVKIEDTDQNPIDFAAMILHEGIHAEIFRYVNEHHEGYVDPNDKPQLFEYYQYYKYAVEGELIDHPYMAKFYVTPIAEALRALDNNQYPLNYYKPFALDGLRGWGFAENEGIDENYGQYSTEVTLNFNLKCDE